MRAFVPTRLIAAAIRRATAPRPPRPPADPNADTMAALANALADALNFIVAECGGPGVEIAIRILANSGITL